MAALVAATSDLLSQLTEGRSSKMFSSLVLLHEGPAREDGQSADSYIVDPSLEETKNLSNNLVLVTVVRKQQ